MASSSIRVDHFPLLSQHELVPVIFLEPYGKLYLKMQLVLAQNQTIEIPKRRSGPKKPRYGITSSERPNVLRRVLENEEPLRTIADDYGVSHETIRRLIRASRKKKAG